MKDMSEIEQCLQPRTIKIKKKKKQKVYYVAGAYRTNTIHGTLENIRKAEFVAIEIWKAGHVALCPHLNSRLMDGIIDDEEFLEGDLELLKRCDGIVLVPGWSISQGAIKEKDFAIKNNISICKIKQLSKEEYVISEIC